MSPPDRVTAPSSPRLLSRLGRRLPVYPGKRYLDWDLPDPAGLDLAAARPIRDDINQRVRQLLAVLKAFNW
jgi:hypothetical protein